MSIETDILINQFLKAKTYQKIDCNSTTTKTSLEVEKISTWDNSRCTLAFRLKFGATDVKYSSLMHFIEEVFRSIDKRKHELKVDDITTVVFLPFKQSATSMPTNEFEEYHHSLLPKENWYLDDTSSFAEFEFPLTFEELFEMAFNKRRLPIGCHYTRMAAREEWFETVLTENMVLIAIRRCQTVPYEYIQQRIDQFPVTDKYVRISLQSVSPLENLPSSFYRSKDGLQAFYGYTRIHIRLDFHHEIRMEYVEHDYVWRVYASWQTMKEIGETLGSGLGSGSGMIFKGYEKQDGSLMKKEKNDDSKMLAEHWQYLRTFVFANSDF
jgi:hypothetical protein